MIAHVSNLKPVKRPLDLVRSAVETTRRDARLMYLIIGDGPLRKRMEEACRQAGVRDRFWFAGWIDYAAMPGYLSVADLVVMPSESEGLARAYGGDSGERPGAPGERHPGRPGGRRGRPDRRALPAG